MNEHRKSRAIRAQMAKSDFLKLSAALTRSAAAASDWPSRLESTALAAAAFALVLAGSSALGAPQAAAMSLAALAAIGAAYWSTGHVRGRMILRTLRRDGAFLRPFRFAADLDGVSVASDVSELTLKWPAVFAIEVTSDLILLYIDRANAVALPKSAFADEAAMRAYAEELTYLKKRAGEAAPDKEVAA